MPSLHHTLHLQHRGHTGRLLHHRHTSYRGLSVVLGLATAGIIGLNVLARATADSLYVNARIAAPIPTTAAVITVPSEGAVLHTSTLTVQGTCPAVTPQVIITILDNGVSAGSAACTSSDGFVLPITLVAGSNMLVARSTTITNDTGPDSAPVHVTYVPPEPAIVAPTSSHGSTSSPTAVPGVLSINPLRDFIIYGPSRTAIWSGRFMGGTLPYRVEIDWGDGANTAYQVNDHGVQNFAHHYHRMRPYDITVQVRDAAGNTFREHFAAVTPYVPPLNAGGSTIGGGFWGSIFQALGWPRLFALYLLYLLVLVLFGYGWLHRHPFAYAKIPARTYRPTAVNRKSSQSRRKR